MSVILPLTKPCCFVFNFVVITVSIGIYTGTTPPPPPPPRGCVILPEFFLLTWYYSQEGKQAKQKGRGLLTGHIAQNKLVFAPKLVRGKYRGGGGGDAPKPTPASYTYDCEPIKSTLNWYAAVSQYLKKDSNSRRASVTKITTLMVVP